MRNMKLTKKAFLASLIVMVVCFAMLIGTTYAWFTDSVSSANNIIQAGNLDVKLEYKTNWSNEWAPVDENTKLFKEGALYEPGYTEIVYLRVSNAGSLALKYMLSFNISNEERSLAESQCSSISLSSLTNDQVSISYTRNPIKWMHH